MTSFFFLLMMFLGGIAVAIQPSLNSRLAARVGLFESSLISFLVGTIAMLTIVLLFGRGNLRGVADANWWELTGGLLGAFFVTLTILIVPRIGTASAMAATIAAQLLAGLVLDHFGLFGFHVVPFDTRRAIGMLLLLLGAGLVFRK